MLYSLNLVMKLGPTGYCLSFEFGSLASKTHVIFTNFLLWLVVKKGRLLKQLSVGPSSNEVSIELSSVSQVKTTSYRHTNSYISKCRRGVKGLQITNLGPLFEVCDP